jgi:transcriptional regulator with XRE-family HTH domain
MKAQALGKRLREARLSRGFKSAAEAARRFRWNVTSYQQAENGTRPPTRDKITEYAQKFQVSVSWLLTGEGTPEETEFKTVPFLGHIDEKTGKLVENDPGSRPEVTAPPGATKYTVAIRARGGGRVVNAGALLYYENRRRPPTDNLINRLCVLALPNNDVMVRRVERGTRNGVYTLTNFIDAPLVDQQPVWVAEIVWIRQP